MADGGRPRSNAGDRRRIWPAVLLGIALLAAYMPRLTSVFTEAVNWDELTMLERSDRTARLGEVVGGSRPGLVSLFLAPLFRNCADVISVALEARLIWQLVVLAYLVGVYALLRRWFEFARRPESGRFEGAAAVALLAFLPAFVTWSVQVRSDQPALAAAIWGGVSLMGGGVVGSAVAGLLFGAAVLCTQKGVYTIALCMLLWSTAAAARIFGAGAVARGAEVRARARQLVVAAAAGAATIVAYGHLVPESAYLAGGGAVESGWQEMRRVRGLLGYRAYVAELLRAPWLPLLVVAMLGTSVRSWLDRRHDDIPTLGTGWLVLVLGAAVIIFHGSSYPYFIMTSGLFPAIAIGIAAEPIARQLGARRNGILALLLLVLVAGSIPPSLELLRGTQANQHDMVAWLKDSGLAARSGFQVDGALVCLGDRDQIPPLSHQVNARGGLSESETDALITEFRRRQVAYVVDAARLYSYPETVRRFWGDHYVWYYGAVWVSGFWLAPGMAATTLDVFVPGTYRWTPGPGSRGAVLAIDGRRVAPGARIELGNGKYEAVVIPASAGGALALDLRLPERVQNYSFIDPTQLDRLYLRE